MKVALHYVRLAIAIVRVLVTLALIISALDVVVNLGVLLFM